MNGLATRITQSAVWRSFFRHGWPRTALEQSLVVTSNVVLHLHPVKVRRHAVKLGYTWGLGGISALLFIILAITGVVLMFGYVPSTELAYFNIKELAIAVPFGLLMRNMHRWAAHGMVIFVVLHMLRVFYTGAYKVPREFNWVVGIFLLLLTMLASFTGYLLPWDQLSYWAITVGTSIAGYVPLIGHELRFFLLGGPEVGQGALIRFYTLHVIAIPGIMLVLMAVHFWRIRKDGGISGPRKEEQVEGSQAKAVTVTEAIFPAHPTKTYGLLGLARGTSPLVEKEPEDTVMTWPNLVVVEFAAALVVLALLIIISLMRNAPLEEIANPDLTPNPAKAPWYFLALQEMLLHMHPTLAGVIIPGLVTLFFLTIPYIDRDTQDVGIYFASKKGKLIAQRTAIATVLVVVALVLFDEYVGLRTLLAGLPDFVSGWLAPIVIIGGLLAVLYAFVRRAGANRRETLIAIVTSLAVAAMTLTIIGTVFRGEGMHLYWPFEE